LFSFKMYYGSEVPDLSTYPHSVSVEVMITISNRNFRQK